MAGTKDHPDPIGANLARAARALKAPLTRLPRLGVFWDFGSLYQHPDPANGVVGRAHPRGARSRTRSSSRGPDSALRRDTRCLRGPPPPPRGVNKVRATERMARACQQASRDGRASLPHSPCVRLPVRACVRVSSVCQSVGRLLRVSSETQSSFSSSGRAFCVYTIAETPISLPHFLICSLP